MNKTELENIQNDSNHPKLNQPSFYSSQAKRPMIHFGNIDPNNLDINNNPNMNQSFNIMNSNNISNNSNNNDNSGTNLAFYNKSVQQEKYDSIKIFCSKKNDPDNYPLISYENFLLIDGLCEKNT